MSTDTPVVRRRFDGPKGRPLLGSLLEAWSDPLSLMLDGMAKYGPIAQYRFAYLDYIVIAEPDAAHYVLVENNKNYTKSQNYEGLKILLGAGLLTSEGEFWRKQRRLAQPAFHREKLAAFVQTMAECTDAMLTRWQQLPTESLARVDLHREMMRLTFHIVGKTLLSMDLDGASKEVGDALDVALHWTNEYVESVVRIPPWVPTANNRRFRRAQKTLDTLVLGIVERRRADFDAKRAVPNDLLQMLLEAKDQDTGEGMSNDQLKHELLTLVLAGHETTANSLSFAQWLLAEHPEAAERIRREFAEVVGGRTVTVGDLSKLTYTTQVIEEAMRIYPPAWAFERQAIADDVLAGHHVAKKTVIGIVPYVMHRNPALYPEPDKFLPERFDKQQSAKRPKHAYIPFGGGPRMCIGNAFAMMEMQVVLPMILRAAHVHKVPDFSLELEPSVTLRPKSGMPMRIALR
jgi:cytochrome P450